MLIFKRADLFSILVCVGRAMGHGHGPGPCGPMGPRARDTTTTQKTFQLPDSHPIAPRDEITCAWKFHHFIAKKCRRGMRFTAIFQRSQFDCVGKRRQPSNLAQADRSPRRWSICVVPFMVPYPGELRTGRHVNQSDRYMRK